MITHSITPSEQRPDPFAPPARIEALAEATYRALPAANYSSLKVLLDRSPAHVKGLVRKETAALSIGHLAHTMILEGHAVAERFNVQPKIERPTTNQGKAQLVAWLAEVTATAPPASDEKAEGKRLDAQLAALRLVLEERGITVVSQADFTAAQTMRDKLMGHRKIGPLIEGATREVTFIAEHRRSGVLVKARLDLVNETAGTPIVLDLKTTQNASWGEFTRSIGKYQYHLQAALYRWAYAEVMGRWPAWCWVCVESEPPYECAWYEPERKVIEAGEARMEAALNLWADCEQAGRWPGYAEDLQSISLPSYSL
ncbi:PD-(D/E)XK nuclease-like domain-containing protein [uncultured Thiodictyon sp.]|uniref:PD-(D/E)XK nuclease-like domain-containing protein n=1 Tax=uncultured Thiodictyon sp. TaxID=1846217 RepID=UPI0025D2866C|nr:PD-(D/E)XK nuclease-like domain-containing protein [uncultured Thiodictyon sp.]